MTSSLGLVAAIDRFNNNFSPSGEQPEHSKLARDSFNNQLSVV